MIVALTGGIGCGKSLVLQYFSELGWKVLSADAICHEIYRDNREFSRQLIDRWGDVIAVEDGLLNRRAIAGIVFQDPGQLQWLNGILHPMIRAEAERRVAANAGADFIFEIPLLYETGWHEHYETVICVWSEPDIARRRLLARGLEAKDIECRLKNQMSPELKLEKADYGLINNGSAENLFEQCEILNKKLKDSYGRKRNCK